MRGLVVGLTFSGGWLIAMKFLVARWCHNGDELLSMYLAYETPETACRFYSKKKKMNILYWKNFQNFLYRKAKVCLRVSTKGS